MTHLRLVLRAVEVVRYLVERSLKRLLCTASGRTGFTLDFLPSNGRNIHVLVLTCYAEMDSPWSKHSECEKLDQLIIYFMNWNHANYRYFYSKTNFRLQPILYNHAVDMEEYTRRSTACTVGDVLPGKLVFGLKQESRYAGRVQLGETESHFPLSSCSCLLWTHKVPSSTAMIEYNALSCPSEKII